MCQTLRKDLIKKTRLVADLQRRNVCLSRALEDAQVNPQLATAMEELQVENDRLKRQIFEMESFLSDYGLVWVGSREEDNNDDTHGKETKDSFTFDVDKFFARVKVSIYLPR